MSPSEIVYAAHTPSCTFLLDAAGMCRRVLTRSKSVKESSIAKRCLGAQYVASLDMTSEGGLVEMPTRGAYLLFARIDDGRVALVKTAPLDRFEEVVADVRPRVDTGSTTQKGFRTERMAHPPAFDIVEDDPPDARTNEIHAVRDADRVLAQRYHQILDRAAHVPQIDVDEDTAPTGTRRGPPTTKPRTGAGVLPKRRR